MAAAGRTVLVTGSTDTRSLGFTVAKFLALPPHNFAHVILSGRRADAADAAAAELRKALPAGAPTTVHALTLDVANTASVHAAAARLAAADGPLAAAGGRLDVLVNNAGVGAPPGRVEGTTQANMFLQTELTTAADVLHVLTTNVAGVVELTNALLPHLAKSPAPRVVNVSSARGSISFAEGLPPARTGALVYNTSKAALNMVTVMQSKNLPAFAPGLKVNAGSPGHVKTPFNNFTGLRTLDEGAAVLVHLATLPADGPTGELVGDHAPFSEGNGKFVKIPW